MSNELSTTLRGPEISGTVTVTLAELDRMRTDHAKAVKLAQDLERNQMRVVVKFEEKRLVHIPSDLSRKGYITDERYVQTGVQYYGLDEVREVIRKEEQEKLDKKIKERDSELLALRNKHLEQSLVLNSTKSELETASKELESATKELVDTKKEFNEYIITMSGIMDDMKSDLNAQIEQAQKEKDHYYRLYLQKPWWKRIF